MRASSFTDLVVSSVSIVYLPFSFLTDYTSVIDFITLGQELSANPLGLFEESPWKQARVESRESK